MSDVDAGRGNVPADWRERLIAVLSADGVTQLPKVAKWKRFLIGCGKITGWILVYGLFCIVINLLLAIPLSLIFTTNVGLQYLNNVGPLTMLLGLWFIFPRIQRAGREVSQIRLGHQPIQVLREAKRAPVLFLRSFNFDSISSSVPKWQRFLPLNVPLPTAELNLVQMIWRHAPVLAIGRPGESTPPAGAVRFYVRDDIWQKTVEAIVPLSDLVVWTTGHTEGLRWEIKHLLERVPPRKIVLWLHFNIGRRKQAERDAEWAKFREGYRDIFPKPLPEDAAKARFIAFKDDWTPVAIPGAGYRPSIWEMIWSWPSTYGLEPLLKRQLG